MSGGIYQSFSKNDSRNFPRYNYQNFFLFPEQRFRISRGEKGVNKREICFGEQDRGGFCCVKKSLRW